MIRVLLAAAVLLSAAAFGSAQAQVPSSPPYLSPPIIPGDCLKAGTQLGQIVDAGIGCPGGGSLNLTGKLTSDTTFGSGAISMLNTANGSAGTSAGLFSGYPTYLFSAYGGWTGPDVASIVGAEFDLKITSATQNSSTYTALVGQCDLYTVTVYVASHTLGCQGIFGIGAILKSQGGTLGSGASGQVWGIAAIAELYNDGTDPPTGIISVTNEFDVIMPTGTSANNRYGLNVVDYGSAVQGATEDAAYVISALTGSIGFKNGILFSSNGGGIPLSTNGSVLTSTTTASLSVTYGIDLANFTISQYAFRGPGGLWQVDGSGQQLTQTLAVAGSFIDGSTGSLILQSSSTTNLTLAGGATPTATFAGSVTAAALSTSGTVAGSLCGTSGGLFVYKSGVNCFANASGAEQTITYQPGLLTAVNATQTAFVKFVKASTVDNIIGSASTFSCVSNPTITLTNTTTSTTMGTVTITAAGAAFTGSISSAGVALGDVLAWAMTAGTCASIDVAVNAQVHQN